MVFAVVLSSFGTAAELRAATKDNDRSQITLQVENDAFVSTDRYYTHATRLDYLFPQDHNPEWLNWYQDWLPDAGNRSTALGITLAQYIYTPPDITVNPPPPDQRPYAGWLYAGLHGVSISEEGVCDLLAINLGVVGPASGSEQVQKTWHKLLDINRPQGWDSQIPNEPALDVTLQRKWKLHDARTRGLDWEVLPYMGANIGNVFFLVRIGATLRGGLNIPEDFGYSAITPSVAGKRRDDTPPKWGVHAFATVEPRFVAHNVFVDGSLFQNSPSVTHEPLVADVVAGVSATVLRLSLTYAYVVRTEEFRDQNSEQEFGSVNVAYRF